MSKIHCFLRGMILVCVLSNIAHAADADQLYKAAQKSDVQTAKTLLDKGADVNSRSSTGSYPIHAAAVNNDKDMLDLLIAKGANLGVQNKEGDTPLICATKYGGGKEATVKVLLAAGADSGIADKKGKTALDYAKEKEQKKAIELLTKGQ
jgi:ankyrin repeat protein